MRLLPFVCCAALVACASSKPKPEPVAAQPAPAKQAPSGKLYDRLGGKPAIEAVVDEFLARVAADERINAGFAGSNLPKVRQRLVELICMASGGPCVYSGRDMKTAHAGMGVTGAQFDALAGHLIEALDKFKVPEKEKGEVIALVAPMKPDIVEEP
jgi:hemoglobin